MSFKKNEKQQKYQSKINNQENKQGEEDNADNESVISVDVMSYQRQPAYNQPNTYHNIQHRTHYLHSQNWSRNNYKTRGRGRGRRGRGRGSSGRGGWRNLRNNTPNNDDKIRQFDVNNKSLIKWTAQTEDIAEVRKYGSYEFYLNNEQNVNVVIRYGNKLILMKNDYDKNIWGSFIGGFEDWMEWFHAYVHDSFNRKNIDQFKSKFMSYPIICGKDLNAEANKEILRRIVHEMALSGWNDGLIYMHKLFGHKIFTLLSNGKNAAIHQAAYSLHNNCVHCILKLGAKYNALSGYKETIDQVAISGFYNLLTKTLIIPLIRCHTAPKLIQQLQINDEKENKQENEEHKLEFEGLSNDLNSIQLNELIKKYYNMGQNRKQKHIPFEQLKINEKIMLSKRQYNDRIYLCRLLSGNGNNNTNPINFSLESCYYGTIMDAYYYVCSFYINSWYKAKDSGNQRWILTPKLTTNNGIVYGTISCKQTELYGRVLTVIPKESRKRLELTELKYERIMNDNAMNISDYQLFRFEHEKVNENNNRIWCRIVSKSGHALILDYEQIPYSNASLRIRNAVIRCTESFPDCRCRDLFSPFPYTTLHTPSSKLEIACGNKKYQMGDYKVLFQHCKFWKAVYKQFNKIQVYAARVQSIVELFEKYDQENNSKQLNVSDNQSVLSDNSSSVMSAENKFQK